MLPLHSFIYSISCLVKKCMNYDGKCKFCYEKKNLKKQRVYWNKKLSTVYYYSEKLYKQMMMYFRSN